MNERDRGNTELVIPTNEEIEGLETISEWTGESYRKIIEGMIDFCLGNEEYLSKKYNEKPPAAE